MATQEQISAVTQAMVEQRSLRTGVPRSTFGQFTMDGIRADARAAITAYEATRPAVATDRELWEAFWDHAEIVDGDTESIRAGIRAVRERLALAAPALSRPEFQIGDVVHVAGKGRQRFDIVVHHKEKYGVCREGVQENHRLVDPESLIPLAAALAETEESDHAD